MPPQAARAPRAFTAPDPLWFGHMDVVDGIKMMLHNARNTDPRQTIREAQDQIRRAESRIDEIKETIRINQEVLKREKLRKREQEETLADALERLNNPLVIDDDEVTDVQAFIRNLPGVLGVIELEDGSIKVLTRTAIRSVSGKLYDMGDFQFVLPVMAIDRRSYHWHELSNALQIQCVRLPRKSYDNWGNIDFRMHHHYGRIATRSDGSYYVLGGQFCTGTRAQAIAQYIEGGNLKQALSLLVDCLNNSQNTEDETLASYGRFIPEQHEADFYAVI